MINLYNVTIAQWFEWYEDPNDIGNWMTCRRCGYKPKIWVFDNGRFAECVCAKSYSKYDKFRISCESIMSHLRKTNGSLIGYDGDGLRKAWNKYVEGVEETEAIAND